MMVAFKLLARDRGQAAEFAGRHLDVLRLDRALLTSPGVSR